MEALLDKLEKLKNSLDNEEIILRIKKINKEILEDTELIDMINEYKISGNEELKNKIYSNILYREYKSCETELNLMIMAINNKLKNIINKEHCI